MNIWIASDFHYGKYAMDSDKWINIMDGYFYNFFIPLLKENMKNGDVLVITGDIFDNRNSIGVKVINSVIQLFETLSKIIPVHVLVGNHDMYLMNSTDINSVATIRNIKNVTVYTEPTEITFDDHSVLMMPWIHGKDAEKDVLDKYSGKDLLFCHSDLNGCRTQLYPTRPISRTILDIDDFSGYKQVFSGHIHIVQEINNFIFVGSPYHLDRNDIGNTKGVFVYNTKKKKHIFIENDYSPEFKKIKLLKELDLDKLKEQLKTNNFIDLEISNNLIANSPHIRLEIDKLSNKYKIENIYFINDIVDEERTKNQGRVDITESKSIKDLSFEWVDKIKIDESVDLFTDIEIKGKMKETIEECFNLLDMNKK